MHRIRKKTNLTQVIFVVYCLLLIWLVMFKLAFSVSGIYHLKAVRSINLIPFYYDVEVGGFHTKEVALNVLVFIPFGLYLKMLNVSEKKAVLYGCAASFTLELCQLLFSVGKSDITDLLTNTLGTAIGVCAYALARWLFRDAQKTDRMINGIVCIALSVFFLLFFLLYFAN